MNGIPPPDIYPIDCTLICHSNVGHLAQLYAGYGILEKRGLLKGRFIKNGEYKRTGKQLLTVLVNNRYRLAYDTSDCDSIYTDELIKSDLYFKRSYDSSKHAALSSKIHPLGFYYKVYGENDRALNRALWSFRENGSSTTLGKLADVVHSSKVLSRLFRADSGGRQTLHFRELEGVPKFTRSPTILFMARVWDPNSPINISQTQAEERVAINFMRAECIRKLRREFGRSFIGGLAADELAKRNFGDCVVDDELTEKSAYLRAVRSASICVSTMGLCRSNGAKIGEYIAGSKAIVSETLHYEVPGDFTPGKHYLPFRDPDACVQQVARLFNSPDLCHQLMQQNHAYYHSYLRPDLLIWNTLQTLAARAHLLPPTSYFGRKTNAPNSRSE